MNGVPDIEMETTGVNGIHKFVGTKGQAVNGTLNGTLNGTVASAAASCHYRAAPTDREKLAAVTETANYLLSRTKHRPRIAIICGTGLGGLSSLVEDATVFEYRDIPNFIATGVKGHAGRMLFGMLNGKCVVCMHGRTHAFEGHSMWQVAFPIRVFHALGIRVMVVTNASGSVNPDFKTGDFVIMKDHINLLGLAGCNPLVGLNDERFGTRFPPMTGAYDAKFRRLARQTATELGLDFVREGVYFCQMGPCFETPAECRMIRGMGADVVGMSTTHEVMVARHGGTPMRVLGLSLITNECILSSDDDPDQLDIPDHEEVLKAAEKRANDLKHFVSLLIGKLDE